MLPKQRDENVIDLLDAPSLAELAQADQVIAALGDAFPPAQERRQAPRLRYQVRARLELVDELTGKPFGESMLHTRDLDPSGSGFVTPYQIAENERAVLCLPSPHTGGSERRINCRVRRSREVGNGWFEGTVEFDQEQPVFSHTRIRPKFGA